MMVQRELLLLRHALANRGSASGRDFDRELSATGRAQPDGIGRHLVAAGFRPQLVLCSASARTRETLTLLEDSGLCRDATIEFSEGLYECSTRQILFELAAVDEAVQRVLLVGHNPSLSDLATALTRRPVGLNPGDSAWLDFDGDWATLDAQRANLKML